MENIEKLITFYEQEDNITRAAKLFAEVEGVEYTDSFRRKCSKFINSGSFSNNTVTETNQYSNDREVEDDFFMPSAWDSENNRFLSVDEYCDKYNLPKESVRSSKLIAHNGTHMVYNMVFNQTTLEDVGIDEEFIESVVKKHIIPSSYAPPASPNSSSWFDRLVITDIHIGMSTEGGRNVTPLYDFKWDEAELTKRLALLIDHVKKFKKGNVLVIDELGDYMDGLLGQTTRGGHELPQNMSDKEAFELGVKFKLDLISNLIDDYDKIIFNSITEDNHSGIFGYFVNSTIKKIAEQSYGAKIEYNLMERFINHYLIGGHTFVISHGKDSEALKFGFKPILDAKQAEKIDQYCKEYKLYDGSLIEFSKGDSHQCLLDYTSSNDFQYCNYPAFSPPSNWVKSNFKNSKSGFVFYNIEAKNNTKITIPYWF